MLARTSLLAFALSLSAPGQRSLVLPQAAASADAITHGRIAGFVSPFRQQILIDAGQLGGIANTDVTALAFRRDGQYARPLVGGTATIKITVSTTARLPQDASAAFIANHGAITTVVFDGPVSLPSSPALTHRDAATWAAPHAVVIPFTTPFRYVDSTLVIDLEGTPTAPTTSWWPVDFIHDAARGGATAFGRRCGRYSGLSTSTTAARIGNTLHLAATGEASSAGAMLIGASSLVPGFSLGFLGAPACDLAVQPALVSPSWYQPFRPDSTAPGMAGFSLQLPYNESLLGGRLFAQALNLVPSAPGGLTTTSGLTIAVGGSAPTVLWATVESFVARTVPVSSTGLVELGRMPVLRLTVR